jgi:hypothetical protein
MTEKTMKGKGKVEDATIECLQNHPENHPHLLHLHVLLLPPYQSSLPVPRPLETALLLLLLLLIASRKMRMSGNRKRRRRRERRRKWSSLSCPNACGRQVQASER